MTEGRKGWQGAEVKGRVRYARGGMQLAGHGGSVALARPVVWLTEVLAWRVWQGDRERE